MQTETITKLKAISLLKLMLKEDTGGDFGQVSAYTSNYIVHVK